MALTNADSALHGLLEQVQAANSADLWHIASLALLDHDVTGVENGAGASLKMVVVVDDDVNVHDGSNVLRAMATRMQAQADVLRNVMGAILDPSNNNGLTDKLIIDATCPQRDFPARQTLDPAAVTRAQALIAARYG